MALPNFHTLRTSAGRSLDAAQNPKRIILLHSGVILLVSVLLALADYLLEQQISNTGGLGGLGARSVLSTIQSVLQLAQMIVLPFWQIGYVYYTLKVAQGNDVGAKGLLEGFRRFGPILRLKMLLAGIFFLVAMVSSYFGSAIFMLTPWSAPLFEVLEPMLTGTMDEAAIMELYDSIPISSIIPMMVLFLVCFIALVIPIYFRYRMADLWLMDHPGQGALAALRGSRRMMKGNCIAVFKVDLHWWWFFLLDVLISMVGYGDMILKGIGITLPFSASVAFYLFYVVYLALQLLLYVWHQNEVSVTYAHAYETLKPAEEEQPRPNPWTSV